MTRRLLVRPRFQRYFLEWLEASRPRFMAPPEITLRTDTRIKWRFAGITPAITGSLSRNGIWIAADLGCDEQSDGICDLDCLPVKNEDGYVCSICEHFVSGDLPVYASRKEFWVAQNFEPMLEWVNQKLWPATALACLWKPGKFFSAELADSEKLQRLRAEIASPRGMGYTFVPVHFPSGKNKELNESR